MSLETNTGKSIFVNISNGRLYTKEKDKEPVYFDTIGGTIIGVTFKEEEYQGKKYEKAHIAMMDGEEKYDLGIRTDSGYFRGFCNSLKNGDPTEKIKVSPSYKEKDGKPQTTCFVQQRGQALKHAYTMANMGDLPQVEKVTFKGQTQYDGSAQIAFWKNWLLSIKFEHPLFAGEAHNISEKEPENMVEETADSEDDGLPF